jgi:hypothetical protein
MADDETTDTTEATKTPKEPRASVTLPVWALVVVGALAAGGIGYAIGNSNDDSRNLINPIADVRSAPGDDQDSGDDQGNREECPRPREGREGGQLQGPGGPGFGPGVGPDGLPGGPLGPGFENRDERGNPDGGQDQNQDQNQNSEDSNV